MRKREREKNKTGRNWGEKGRPFAFSRPANFSLAFPFRFFPTIREPGTVYYWPSMFGRGDCMDTSLFLSSPSIRRKHQKTNRELKQRRFLATHVNRKWGLFSYNMTWRRQICIAKCLYSHRDDLAEAFGLNYCPWMKKVRFRLTYVAKKTSLLKPRPHAWCVKHNERL